MQRVSALAGVGFCAFALAPGMQATAQSHSEEVFSACPSSAVAPKDVVVMDLSAKAAADTPKPENTADMRRQTVSMTQIEFGEDGTVDRFEVPAPSQESLRGRVDGSVSPALQGDVAYRPGVDAHGRYKHAVALDEETKEIQLEEEICVLRSFAGDREAVPPCQQSNKLSGEFAAHSGLSTDTPGSQTVPTSLVPSGK